MKRIRAWVGLGCLLLLLAGFGAGCHTLTFYSQAVGGQFDLLRRRHPVAQLIQDPATPRRLVERFKLVERLAAFAEQDLALPRGHEYQSYVDVGRRYVVWNVVAASEFSLEPKEWWYPLVGRLDYRGYFSRQAARKYARWLRGRGFDVDVHGVKSYSTLGWFRDPILNTFIHGSEAELAELVFHELTHRRVFVRGDTEFNEALATAVSQAGVQRWFAARHDRRNGDAYRAQMDQESRFIGLILQTRRELETLYEGAGDLQDSPGRAQKRERVRAQKRAILARLQARSEPLEPGDDRGDREGSAWNNARLNAIDTYYKWVPAFRRLLDQSGQDFGGFFVEVERMASLGSRARKAALAGWLEPVGSASGGAHQAK